MQNSDNMLLEHWKGKKNNNMQSKNNDGVSTSHIGESFLYVAVICALIAASECY